MSKLRKKIASRYSAIAYQDRYGKWHGGPVDRVTHRDLTNFIKAELSMTSYNPKFLERIKNGEHPASYPWS